MTGYKDNEIKEQISQCLNLLKDVLGQDLRRDTRNVLLTYARIWSTVETDSIRSKPEIAHLEKQAKIEFQALKSLQQDISSIVVHYMTVENIGFNSQ